MRNPNENVLPLLMVLASALCFAAGISGCKSSRISEVGDESNGTPSAAMSRASNDASLQVFSGTDDADVHLAARSLGLRPAGAAATSAGDDAASDAVLASSSPESPSSSASGIRLSDRTIKGIDNVLNSALVGARAKEQIVRVLQADPVIAGSRLTHDDLVGLAGVLLSSDNEESDTGLVVTKYLASHVTGNKPVAEIGTSP